MQREKLYQQMQSKRSALIHFFPRRPLITMAREDFEPFRDYFSSSRNILNQHQNFRTTEYFKHIHAIETENEVRFHYDYINPDHSILLAFLHLFVDVLPYFATVLVRSSDSREQSNK